VWASIVMVDMVRTLVLLDDGAQHDAVAAEVAAEVDAGEMTCRVVAADEDVWQTIRRVVSCEQFDLVVLAMSSLPGPRFAREVARIFGLPVLWIPLSPPRRVDPPDDGPQRWSYACPASGTDVGRVR
jgi:hypothetical protein